MPEPSAPDWINGDPVDLRRWRAAQPEVVAPVLPADVTISALQPDGGCPGGLRFLPDRATGVPVIYFHGGGFIVGSPETHRINAAWIAHLTAVEVVSIRYRLAPEHPLPAQAEDAAAAIRRQLRRHAALRLMGDSAGGLVALWGHAALTPEERARISDAVLFYPGGLVLPRPDTGERDEADGLGPKSLASYRRKLDPAGIMPGHPLYDPLVPGFALPERMTVLGAGDDPVLDAAEALAALPGGQLVLVEGQGHGFLAALPDPAVVGPLRVALGLAG